MTRRNKQEARLSMRTLLLTLLLASPGLMADSHTVGHTQDCAWLVNHIRDHGRSDHAKLKGKDLKKHMRKHEKDYMKRCGQSMAFAVNGK